MKVLLLGATGNLGLRLIPALLTHNHTVVAYVRSSSKLASLLPPTVNSQIAAVVQGDAKDSVAIKNAILDNGCDAVVNVAGLAAMAPWGSSDLPDIVHAVADAARDAGKERGGKPLRVWFLGGFTLLELPGTKIKLSR
jgi:nucleoside-diphosphate-sugar epimerase